jgi:outer membrane receptor protein involved in Fe transport
LFTRAGTGELQQFVNFNRNAASLKTDGVDVGARLDVPLGFSLGSEGDGALTFDFKGSYLITLDYAVVPGLPTNECAGSFGRVCSRTVAFGPTPNWRHALRTTYREDGAFVSLLWRHIGPSNDEDPTTTYAVERLNAVNYFDLTAGIDVTENVSVALGVDNLFNKGFQPIASNQQGGNGQQSNTYPATYDVLGRFYTLSANFRF